MTAGRSVLGAVIAGGASSRFGAPKALAEIGGRAIVLRAADALRSVVPNVVAIANDPDVAAAIGLPWRRDVLRDAGAVAGIHAALLWARERDADGVIVAACDMPFVDPRVLDALLAARAGVDAVLPRSGGPRGVEPLCAWYGTACIAAIETAVARGDRRMIGFHDAVRVRVLEPDALPAGVDAERAFLNVNTRADLERVQRAASPERPQ